MLNQVYQHLKHLFSSDNARACSLLQNALLPLAEIDQKLAEKSLAFILNAEHVEVLLELQQLADDKACLLLGNPGVYHWYHGQATLSKAQEKLATKSKNARKELYEGIFELLSTAQIIRLGKLLEAATQQRTLTHLYPDLPIWFHYIVIDGLVSSLAHLGFSERDHSKALRQHWSLAQLTRLLQADEAGQSTKLIAFLFERQNVPSYYNDQLDILYKLSDSVAYLEQHLTELQHNIPKLSADAQLKFLDFIKKQKDLRSKLPELLVILSISPAKKVRDSANSTLADLSKEDSMHFLSHYLQHGSSKQRGYAAEILARLHADSTPVLEQALQQETQKSVQLLIQTAIQRLSAVSTADAVTHLETPPVPTLPDVKIPAEFTQVVLDNYQQILEKARIAAANEIEENKNRDYKYQWANNQLKRLQKVKTESLERVVAYLNGETALKRFENSEQIINYKNALKHVSGFNIVHALRVSALDGRHYINWSSIFEMLKPEQYADLELRQLLWALEQAGFNNPKRMIAKEMLIDHWHDLNAYLPKAEQIWPFFAENIEYLGEALGLTPSQEENKYQSFDIGRAIVILNSFPEIPQQFIPRLLEFALGENKRLRFDAQQALHRLPNIHLRAIDALSSGKQEIRITAIEWLARLQHPDAVPALNALLAKEKKEVVRAAILTALEKLGQDIQAYLQPEVLLKEAQQGLKAKLSASFAWFDFSQLPRLTWQNAQPVDPDIIRWWLVLAEKLKDPKANELLQRYMGLLSEKSQQQLSAQLLQSFIYQDTRGPTAEEATALAQKEAPSRLANYQDWAKRYPDYYGKYASYTLEQVIDEIKRAHMATYLGSAIKSKGMLALTHHAQGSFAVKQLQDYMKQHYQRRAQIEAMLNALSLSNDPLIIQLLLGLSRRYRTASVQTLANQLVSDIAARNDWSSDELADRTIPTAGLDENGILQIDYGSRQFTAIVDDKDKFVLKNEEGKIIKALPAARQHDDNSLIKEAKALLSNSKKELKQVLELQTQRLNEAMCSQRQWPVAEWQEYIYAHPIMQRLIQRLVWQEQRPDGVIQYFRPSDDGCLLNLDDDEVELSADSTIQISHAVYVGEELAQQWLAHFKDYKVKFLFEQMSHALPSTLDLKAEQFDDRKGWLTDTYTLRGVLNKLGYQRAAIEDAGSFDRYTKSYKQLGIDVHISFSGSYVPEENIPAVLYELSFERKAKHYWNNTVLTLNEVPEILLAESYADYHSVAAACAGYDPEWEKKTPW
ncbi:DUF4132 domain-containing protein [Acinetobacter larvae]|uniref:DUF4132 domain-containing protein n=1 Tax=Acinetobacter larvae TaxID=1789224 RepID=A0A1B2LWP3_9GAMM|nr:DUF4132 domain-containing protein [Acinetobacter larvae]AOA57357.1 hypothetical protein BFG52_02610 [Acinetobacter larvae]